MWPWKPEQILENAKISLGIKSNLECTSRRDKAIREKECVIEKAFMSPTNIEERRRRMTLTMGQAITGKELVLKMRQRDENQNVRRKSDTSIKKRRREHPVEGKPAKKRLVIAESRAEHFHALPKNTLSATQTPSPGNLPVENCEHTEYNHIHGEIDKYAHIQEGDAEYSDFDQSQASYSSGVEYSLDE